MPLLKKQTKCLYICLHIWQLIVHGIFYIVISGQYSALCPFGTGFGPNGEGNCYYTTLVHLTIFILDCFEDCTSHLLSRVGHKLIKWIVYYSLSSEYNILVWHLLLYFLYAILFVLQILMSVLRCLISVRMVVVSTRWGPSGVCVTEATRLTTQAGSVWVSKTHS